MDRIDLCGQPLDLDLTFCSGQAFRWRRTPAGTWKAVVRDRVVELCQADGSILWKTEPPGGVDLVRDYLRLDEDVNSIYAELGRSDPLMDELIARYRGLRILRQDPDEALLSFVCSAANSIPRITASVEALAAAYGTMVCEADGVCCCTFPTIEMLAAAQKRLFDDSRLLGFRDAKLRSVAAQAHARGPGWLLSLRSASYSEAYRQLIGLDGVGPKIADCVCLFSLDKDEAVPVDTHVLQIAHRLWGLDAPSRGLSISARVRIKKEFAERYGRYAGWAQQFLFYDDLLRTRSLGRGVRWCGWSVDSARPCF